MAVQRDENGKWLPGQTANPKGRPTARQEDTLADARQVALQILSETITPEDWKSIIEKQVQQAKNGSWRSVQWLSSYVLGAPPEIGEKVSQKVLVVLNWGGENDSE